MQNKIILGQNYKTIKGLSSISTESCQSLQKKKGALNTALQKRQVLVYANAMYSFKALPICSLRKPQIQKHTKIFQQIQRNNITTSKIKRGNINRKQPA